VQLVGLSPVFRVTVWAIPSTVLVILPGFTDPINLPKLIVLWTIAFTSVSLYLLLRNYRAPRVVSGNLRIYLILYLLLIIAMSLFGLLGSDNSIRALFGAPGRNNGLIYYVSIISISVLVLMSSIGRNELAYLRKVILWISIIFGLYCTLQFLNADPIGWSNPYNRIIGTLGNPNFSSSALATFSIFWLYEGFRKYGVSAKIGFSYVVTALYFAFLAWATQALQGVVIVSVGVFIVTYVFLREKWPNRILPWATIFGGGSVMVFMFVSFIGLGPLGSVLEQYTLKLRSVYASIGLRAMIESPLYGVGVDNYNSAFRLYRTPDFVSQYGVGLNADNAHSTPAQIGATFGLIVFVLYIFLHFVVAMRAFRVINSRDKGLNFEKSIAILWILIFAQSMLSIEVIGLGVLNWFLGAVLLSLNYTDSDSMNNKDGKNNKSAGKRQSLPLWTGAATIGLFCASLSPVVLLAREDSAYKNIFALTMQNPSDKDWVRLQYGKLTPLTLLEPMKVSRILENMFNSDMNEEIKDVILQVYEANPRDVAANELMATYYRNNGEVESELKVREGLSKLDPVNYQLELNLAKIYADQGQKLKLQNSVSKILSIAPNSEEAKVARELLKSEPSNP
jgi:hypothetical protein